MNLLNPIDLLFTVLESRTQPMHVGGLFLFEVPENCQDDFVSELAKQMLNSKTPSFPFNQVLDRLMFWKEDENFEVYQHFRHIALPKPARIQELLHYVSLEHSRLLNKSNPMWECHIIEGIEPESESHQPRFALYFKIHHSVVDGIAAMRLARKSLSESAIEPMHLPLWSLITRHRSQINAILPEDRSVRNIIKEQLSTIKPVFRELRTSIIELKNPDFTSTFEAPKSILNQRITASRRLLTQSYDLNKFKQLAIDFSVSVNDIVLAVCAGVLRNYLLANDALPKKPLIAFVPISLRKDDSDNGNQVSFLLANLATHLDDPVARIKKINASTSNGKNRFGRMTQAEVINYSAITYFWAGLNLLTGLNPKFQAFNLIISNVPGSEKPLYWNGAALQALYPASILLNGQAMNITLATYVDKIEFGITVCDDVLPNSHSLLQLIADEIETLESVINLNSSSKNK